MKTPWHTLLQYGVASATILVLAIAGIILMATVAVAVLISKFLVFIK